MKGFGQEVAVEGRSEVCHRAEGGGGGGVQSGGEVD